MMDGARKAGGHVERAVKNGYGNVFSIIGRVKRAAEQDGQPDRAREFVKRAFASTSYYEVLALCLEYVRVA